MDDELAEIATDVQQDINGLTMAQRRKWVRQFKQSKVEQIDVHTAIKWIALSQQWSAAKAAVDMLAHIRNGRLHPGPAIPRAADKEAGR